MFVGWLFGGGRMSCQWDRQGMHWRHSLWAGRVSDGDEVRNESGNGERKQRMRGTRERQSTQLCDGEEKTPRPKTLIYPSLLL